MARARAALGAVQRSAEPDFQKLQRLISETFRNFRGVSETSEANGVEMEMDAACWLFGVLG